MSLTISLRGVLLSQEQLDAIVPVMNKTMRTDMSPKEFEAACINAMREAGCPLRIEGDEV